MRKPKQYLSRPQVAARIGVATDTVNRYKLPEPDVLVGQLPGWAEKTIDEWQVTRPGRGKRRPKVGA